jgi:hypothetical protein
MRFVSIAHSRGSPSPQCACFFGTLLGVQAAASVPGLFERSERPAVRALGRRRRIRALRRGRRWRQTLCRREYGRPRARAHGMRQSCLPPEAINLIVDWRFLLGVVFLPARLQVVHRVAQRRINLLQIRMSESQGVSCAAVVTSSPP